MPWWQESHLTFPLPSPSTRLDAATSSFQCTNVFKSDTAIYFSPLYWCSFPCSSFRWALLTAHRASANFGSTFINTRYISCQQLRFHSVLCIMWLSFLLFYLMFECHKKGFEQKERLQCSSNKTVAWTMCSMGLPFIRVWEVPSEASCIFITREKLRGSPTWKCTCTCLHSSIYTKYNEGNSPVFVVPWTVAKPSHVFHNVSILK
jgi:hypothetical protein